MLLSQATGFQPETVTVKSQLIVLAHIVSIIETAYKSYLFLLYNQIISLLEIFLKIILNFF